MRDVEKTVGNMIDKLKTQRSFTRRLAKTAYKIGDSREMKFKCNFRDRKIRTTYIY